MAKETEWGCRCGAVRARVDLRGGARVVCYCKFCQAFAKHTGAGDQLDAAGGTDVIQTVPERVSILTGEEHLRCLKLSRKGPLRWFVACCGAPLCNTIARRNLPYLSIPVAGLAERDGLSPVLVRANLKAARGEVDTSDQHWPRLILSLALRTIKSWLTAGFRHSPFFDQSGAPVAPVERLTPEQKAAAFPVPEDS